VPNFKTIGEKQGCYQSAARDEELAVEIRRCSRLAISFVYWWCLIHSTAVDVSRTLRHFHEFYDWF